MSLVVGALLVAAGVALLGAGAVVVVLLLSRELDRADRSETPNS